MYSFGASCGTPILDMFSYYLASPLNLILLLFPVANITEGILTLTLLKFGLSGLTFSIFLTKKFHKSDSSIVAFSLCYALMSYAVVYFYNVMWLDALIWLPLIILGIERLFVRKKPLMFYSSLVIGIFSNWYTGYMLCIFSGLYGLYVVFRHKFNKKILWSRIKSFLKMCGYGILAVTTCAFLLLPSFLNLQNHEKTEMSSESINFEIFDLTSKFFVGASNFEQITSEINESFENLPPVYCGIAILLLAIMYFLNSKIKKREKIASGFMLLCGFLSFYLQFINMIWHGFNGNVWYPYRYTFLFTFFMILLAYKSWIHITNFEIKKMIKLAGILTIIAIVVEKFEYPYIQRGNVVLTLTCLICFGIIFYFIIRKKEMKIVFIWLVVFEIFANAWLSISSYGFCDRNEYYNLLNSCQKAVEELPKDDFYRALIDDNLAYNFGLIYGYNSINYSSSTLKNSIKNFFEPLEGVKNFENHLLVFANMPVRNMLLGNRYIINLNEDYSDYTIAEQESLEIGFLVDKELENFVVDETKNAFEIQNELIQKMLRKNIICFERVKYQQMLLENIIREEKLYPSMSDYSTILYIFEELPQKTYMQFFDTNVDVYVNDVKQVFKRSDKKIVTLEDIGKRIEVKFVIKNKGVREWEDPVFYVLNESAFSKVYSELAQGNLKVEKLSDTYLRGRIPNVAENKILFLSIPSDPGWRIKVNGENITPIELLDTFIGVDVPKGDSIIEVIYFPKYFKLGVIISVISIFCAIFFQKS